eukprot:5472163-Amphidinium_carterae.1
MHPEDRRQMDSDASDAKSFHICWYPRCLSAGFRICERKTCANYACGVHSFSIFLPDGSLTAIWCFRHRRPDVTN